MSSEVAGFAAEFPFRQHYITRDLPVTEKNVESCRIRSQAGRSIQMSTPEWEST